MPYACPQCGAQNPDTAQFCYNCGAANPNAAGTIPMASVGKPPDAPVNPYAQQPPSYGGAPPAGGAAANPYGQSSSPYGQGSNPYGQPSNPSASPYAPPPQSQPPYASNPYAAPSYPQPPVQQQQPYAAAPAYGQVGYGAMGGYGGYGAQMSPASPGKRFLAILLDSLVVFVAFAPGLVVQAVGQGADSEALTVIGALLGYALGFGAGLYNIYLLGSRGATIGKKILGLQLLDDTGQPIGFGKAFLREVLKNLVLNFTCLLGGLWLLFDKQHQQLYDKAITANVYEK